MKKFFAITIILILLVSSACADSLTDFTRKWNAYQKHYPCFEISAEESDEEHWLFDGESWKMVVLLEGDHIRSVGIYAEDFEAFVASAIITGSILVDDVEGLNDYIGYFVMKYFRAKTDEDSTPIMYGNYTFGISKKGNGYFLTFAEL